MRRRYLAILVPALALAWACTPAEQPAAHESTETSAAEVIEAASPLMQRAQALFEVVPDTPPELEANTITRTFTRGRCGVSKMRSK